MTIALPPASYAASAFSLAPPAGPARPAVPASFPGATADGGPRFAHASEAEMARILDFYAVAWEYEPHTFPILWNLDGAVVESFSPDFYLPELDLYLEITTLRQKLVRKKNRKLRRLRELYPDLTIKLFYARDFRALMLKYGKLAIAGAITGTLGQVGPGGIVPGLLDAAALVDDDEDAGPPEPAAAKPAVFATARASASPSTPTAPAVARNDHREGVAAP